jgi:hypothetical protein
MHFQFSFSLHITVKGFNPQINGVDSVDTGSLSQYVSKPGGQGSKPICSYLRGDCLAVSSSLKVKSSLYFTRNHAMKTYLLIKHSAIKMYWEVQVYLHTFLTSALDGGEFSASRLGRLTPEVRVPDTHWTGGCVGPRAGLDAMVKR